MWAIEQIEASALAENRAVLLQELPTKMVRHVGRWRQLYYLMNGARIVLLRKFWTMIARLGR